MIDAWLGPIFMGLAGSGHCGAMCGGIAGTLAPGASRSPLRLGISLHAGRLLSYAAAGAFVGALGSLAGHFDALRGALISLRAIAGLLLIGLGASLATGRRSFAILDRIGAPLWQLLRPYAQRLAAPRSPLAALGLGAFWGFLPCGLVYAALGTAAVSGSPLRGAVTMLAFGAGTAPALLMIGSMASRLRKTLSGPGARFAIGLLVAVSGLVNLAASWPSLWGGGAGMAFATPVCCRLHVAH